jgi:hypothetical protein
VIENRADDAVSAGRALAVLRAAALAAVAAGAVGSIVLMLRAGQRAPLLLQITFGLWVLSPFAALAWANPVATRWSAVARATLYCVTVVIAAISLAVYARLLVLSPPGAPNAFIYVVVPPASWVVMTIVAPAVTFMSRRR